MGSCTPLVFFFKYVLGKLAILRYCPRNNLCLGVNLLFCSANTVNKGSLLLKLTSFLCLHTLNETKRFVTFYFCFALLCVVFFKNDLSPWPSTLPTPPPPFFLEGCGASCNTYFIPGTGESHFAPCLLMCLLSGDVSVC